MSKATPLSLFLLALVLSVAFQAGQPTGSSGEVAQATADSAPRDGQDVTSAAGQQSAPRATEQAAAPAQHHALGLAKQLPAHRDDSRPHSQADTGNSGALTTGFWQLADRNREAMYAVLWRSLENGDEEDAELRDFILQTLDGRFDETPGGMFSVLVRSAPTPTLRKEILRLLAEASQELSVGSLSRALDDPDAAVRQSAAASLDGLGVDALLDAMTDAVLDNDHSVRATAFQTLEDMHGFAAIWDVGERVVGDPDPRIRKRALELITYGGVENALAYLTRSLLDPDPGVSELALALLAEFGEGPT